MPQGIKGSGSAKERQARYYAKNREKSIKKSSDWRKKHRNYLGPKRQALVDKINKIKEETPCMDCGNNFPACCMEFDHILDNKKIEVGVLVARTRPWEEIEEEMSKCEIVCCCCHRIRTSKRAGDGWTRNRKPIAI